VIAGRAFPSAPRCGRLFVQAMCRLGWCRASQVIAHGRWRAAPRGGGGFRELHEQGPRPRSAQINFRRPLHRHAKASMSCTRLRSSARSIRVDGSWTAAWATYLGAMAVVQDGAGPLHRCAGIGGVDDLTIRATVLAIVAAAAAVRSGSSCRPRLVDGKKTGGSELPSLAKKSAARILHRNGSGGGEAAG